MDALIKTNHTMVMPMRHITSPKFKWLDASKTDVRRTWRKARLLMRLNKDAYQRTVLVNAANAPDDER
jgi:hypothetical protein